MKRPWMIALILALTVLSAVGAFAVSAAALPGSDTHQVRGERQGPGQERHGQFLERLAQKLGVTPDQLRQAVAETRSELGLGERGPRAWRRGGEGGDRPDAFRFRQDDGERGPGRSGAGPLSGPPPLIPARAMLGEQIETIAGLLGISREQLREELRGKTLESVARSHGVNPDALANALMSNVRNRVDQAVAEGRLSQERADRTLERSSEMIQRMMTFQIPDSPPLRDRPFGEPRG